MNIYKKYFQSNYNYGVLLALIVLFFSFYSSSIVKTLVDEKIDFELANAGSQIIAEFEANLESHQSTLDASVGLFASLEEVSPEGWNRFINSQNVLSLSGVSTLEYVELVKNEEEEYLIVKFVESLDEVDNILGYDMSSEEYLLESFELSRDKNNIVIAAPSAHLHGDVETSFSYMLMPVYDNSKIEDDLSSRREYLQGFIVGVYEEEEFFLALAEHATAAFGVEFFVVDVESEIEIFNGQYELLDIDYTESDIDLIENVQFGTRVWSFQFHPKAIFFEQFKNDLLIPKLILVAGIFVVFIIFIFIFLVEKSRKIAVKVAEDMTKNFNNEKQKLESVLVETKEAKKREEAKSDEVQILNDRMVGRELKMIELKDELMRLKKKDD